MAAIAAFFNADYEEIRLRKMDFTSVYMMTGIIGMDLIKRGKVLSELRLFQIYIEIGMQPK